MGLIPIPGHTSSCVWTFAGSNFGHTHFPTKSLHQIKLAFQDRHAYTEDGLAQQFWTTWLHLFLWVCKAKKKPIYVMPRNDVIYLWYLWPVKHMALDTSRGTHTQTDSDKEKVRVTLSHISSCGHTIILQATLSMSARQCTFVGLCVWPLCTAIFLNLMQHNSA